MILITINNYVHYFEHVFLLTFPGEENIIIKSLGGRFHRNGRIRPIGRLRVTFLIGRLGVKLKMLKSIIILETLVKVLNYVSGNIY